MSYLVDTNVFSEARKSHGHPAVRAWYRSVRSVDIYLSVLVIGEIRRGIERLRRRDVPQAVVFEKWLEGLRQEYPDRIVPISAQIAEEWGRMTVPDPLPVIDGLLAATASMHGFTLVTRNVADLRRTGVRLLNPFDEN